MFKGKNKKEVHIRKISLIKNSCLGLCPRQEFLIVRSIGLIKE